MVNILATWCWAPPPTKLNYPAPVRSQSDPWGHRDLFSKPIVKLNFQSLIQSLNLSLGRRWSFALNTWPRRERTLLQRAMGFWVRLTWTWKRCLGARQRCHVYSREEGYLSFVAGCRTRSCRGSMIFPRNATKTNLEQPGWSTSQKGCEALFPELQPKSSTLSISLPALKIRWRRVLR